MKHLKTYENNIDYPDEGDKILMHTYENPKNKEYVNFINNNIGEVLFVTDNPNHRKIFVKYDDIPKDILEQFSYDLGEYYNSFDFTFSISKHKYFTYGKTLDELQMKLDKNKFNI